MTYKCKICGGQATIDSNNGVVVCNYCGTKQALPLFTADSERLLYDRGNNYLLHSEYDKAENVFNQLLTIKPGAAELYWDLVLCKYGVTYVKDPKTGKYIPTCNRTHYTPIFSDENYKKAIELSAGEKKALFEEDAKTIDNIQKGIIAVSKKEKPFDIFISYKETDNNGNRTKDSVEAQKLYNKLTEAGYKVFFSRITLEDKIGTEYEPYIYAALYSSKVMLTICSSRENIEAVWVKNEWSRFLGFSQIDNSKTLLPLYFDLDKSDLPDEFALLSSYDMSVNGFEDELLRGVKKLIPLPIMKAKKRKQMAKIFSISAACICAFTILATAIFLPGYLKEKKNQEAYLNAQNLFADAQYKEAAKEFELLGNYSDSAYMLERCAIQPNYDAAMQLYYDGKYAEATWAFAALGDYEDAAEQKQKAELSWRKSLATTALYNVVGEYSYGSYYINTNETIDSVPSEPGSAHKNTGINIVSISNGEQLFALNKDGKLENTSQNGNIDVSQWQNIVQATPFIYTTNVALKSDGKVLFGDVTNNEWGERWLLDASNWENIVKLSYDFNSDAAGTGSALAGIDAQGNVFLCTNYYEDCESFLDHKDVFKDVKCIDIEVRVGYRIVNAVALRNDGKLVSYINGKVTVEDAEDIVDVKIRQDVIYKLYNDGNLYKNHSQSVIMYDVVALFDDYLITRSGSVYTLGEKSESTGVKSCVYDEWLNRMG